MRKVSYAKGVLDLFKDKSLYVTRESTLNKDAVILRTGGMKNLGRIEVLKKRSCPWEIVYSRADKKWGPFLYEITLELAGSHGLMSDRFSVSESAKRVWEYYFNNRSDVIKFPLDKDCYSELNEDYFKYGYMKKRKTVIPWLKKNGVWKEL
jgi:hypothetical protein